MKKICFILVFCFFGIIPNVEARFTPIPIKEVLSRYNLEDYIVVEGSYFNGRFLVARSSHPSINVGERYDVWELLPPSGRSQDSVEFRAFLPSNLWGTESPPRILILYKERSLYGSLNGRIVVPKGWNVGLEIDVSNNKIIWREYETYDWITTLEITYSMCLDKVRKRLFENKKKFMVATKENQREIVASRGMLGDEPEFPGGVDAIHQFLQENIILPQSVIDGEVRGTVFVTFVVEKDGSITNVRVLRGIGGGADEEAVRVVELMPNWTPGRERGQPTRVQFNMPIRFTPPQVR